MNNIATQKSNNNPVCTCPHCNSVSITRSGFDRGTQRYRCKTCQRTFKATAGTPVHGLHKKEKIAKYLDALRKCMSVRKAAEYVGISKNTSFTWRHKFLSSLEAQPAVNYTCKTSTVCLIKLEYSAKGRRKPPEKNTLPSKTIALQRDGQLELHKLAPEKHAENAFKISNRQLSLPLISEAEQQIAKLFSWIDRFKGVASKYLQNYWNWYASIFNLSQLKLETEHFFKTCINSRSLAKYYITKEL